jgi:hypothetical protein
VSVGGRFIVRRGIVMSFPDYRVSASAVSSWGMAVGPMSFASRGATPTAGSMSTATKVLNGAAVRTATSATPSRTFRPPRPSVVGGSTERRLPAPGQPLPHPHS